MGHCGFASPLQLFVMKHGFSPISAERAFTHGDKDKIASVIETARELTILKLKESKEIHLDGPRVATSPQKKRALALDYNRVITNKQDAVDVIGYVDRDGGGGGGHADDRAIRLLGKALGIHNLEIVREVLVGGETLLVDVEGWSTALAGSSMVMWQPGHWSAVASNVSSPCNHTWSL